MGREKGLGALKFTSTAYVGHGMGYSTENTINTDIEMVFRVALRYLGSKPGLLTLNPVLFPPYSSLESPDVSPHFQVEG